MSQVVVSVNAAMLLPVLAPAVGAALVLVADVAVQSLRRTHYVIALVSLLVGAMATIGGLGAAAGDVQRTLCLPGSGQCLYAVGSVASALQLAALLAAAVTLLLSWPDDKDQSRGATAVIVSLVLAATAGATAVSGAQDLGSWLVAIELATLPTVALVALRGTRSAISGWSWWSQGSASSSRWCRSMRGHPRPTTEPRCRLPPSWPASPRSRRWARCWS